MMIWCLFDDFRVKRVGVSVFRVLVWNDPRFWVSGSPLLIVPK